MLAFALGVDAGYQIASKHKEGFILESVAKGFDKYPAMSFIYSITLQELIKENRENEINNTQSVYSYLKSVRVLQFYKNG